MKQPKRSIEDDCFGISKHRNSINSKQKGSSNERACARALQLWTGYKFVRVPASGGLRWQNSNNVTGDLICDEVGVDFSFSIETKHLQKLHTPRILPNDSKLFTIWTQANDDSIRSGKLPMALLRKNDMPAGEYYLILDAAQGGTIMSMNTPIHFSGVNHRFSLVGFLFSDVKKYTPYHLFAKAITRSGLVSKSKLFK